MTKVAKDDFLHLHHQGLTAAQLAERFGISQRHVTRLRSELGVAQHVPYAARRMDAEALARAAELLDEGAALKEVGRTVGFDEVTIARHFPGRGWDRSTIGQHAKAIRDANEHLRNLRIKPL
ncbi:helix-turn-helix DNA-binding domain protein [Arthrobacter phage Auxilium]|uniref:Helix-turn-helix DNA-binding domain protein n=1 Tax=Arthrobacter phage Auxilium TaxID=2419948 RepID=A0A3G2KAA5_9CAUD|nr:helix-turn-helix DNA-binding domain protein [Arthrobacter phage Auxilium]AYN55849.1 helix-turn-helix DNA-binding domain protein [Arthrobacter phage Auxilium]